jgi:short subunit dehydrogenase-like uncharacterized protein
MSSRYRAWLKKPLAKAIAESALCLVRDVQGEGGTWTPGALMGPALRRSAPASAATAKLLADLVAIIGLGGAGSVP